MYILCFKKSMNEAKPISTGFFFFFTASPLSAFHNICLDGFRRIDHFTNLLNECRDLVKKSVRSRLRAVGSGQVSPVSIFDL